MFTVLAAQLADGTGDVGTSRERIYEKALYQASCKAAVKGGREDLPGEYPMDSGAGADPPRNTLLPTRGDRSLLR